MEARFCPSCKKPNPSHAIYCYHCGDHVDQQASALQARSAPEQHKTFQPSPFDNRSPFDQPSMQPNTNQVLRCAQCRLLNYSGETSCKRCGGQLVDRNFSADRNNQNHSAAVDPSSNDDSLFAIEKAQKNIRNAWIAGVISASITMGYVLSHGLLSTDSEAAQYAALSALIVYVLSYGIYKKSTFCAMLLCGLFVLDKVIYFMSGGNTNAVYTALLFCFFYARGIEGTIQYHRLTADDPQPAFSAPSSQGRIY